MELELSYTPQQLEIFFEGDAKFNIITKGRRFGATKGGANACIEWALDGERVLWGDTIHSNIKKYFERYFEPELKGLDYDWNGSDKQLKIGDGWIDFRSADRPENWEGFGYTRIFLNEAGIILKNDYLYTNAVLPMLMDYSDSKLYAIGVPKGKHNKDGSENRFFSLFKRAKEDTTGKYRTLQFSSYDNPLLKKQDIEEIKNEIAAMTAKMVDQEIYGEFIEIGGNNPFAHAYDPDKHESINAVYRPREQVFISIDFNIDPFGCIFFHKWRDREGDHCHVFDSISIKDGNLQEMSNQIKAKYPQALHFLEITGDASGNNRRIGDSDNNSLFTQLRNIMGIRESQLRVPTKNPRIKTSRTNYNYFLTHFPDFKINPVTCADYCRDNKIVQCDGFGELIKKNRTDVSQQADFLDCGRYLQNTYFNDWILNHQKY